VLALASSACEQVAAGDYNHESKLGDMKDTLVFGLVLALEGPAALEWPVRTRFERVWPDAAERVEQAWAQAVEILRENWGAIEALANVLLEERVLDHDRVAEVLGRGIGVGGIS
jgi:hypothetical protein